MDTFSAYVEARQRRLLRTAWLLTGDWASAEDLVQTSLVKVWPRFEALAAQGDPDAYVRQVVFRTFVSWRRTAWRRERPVPGYVDVAAPEQDHDLALVLREVLPLLPPRQRAVVVLRYLEDLSEQQTAQVLGCSVGTVKSQASRGLAQLRSRVAEQGVTP